jgi:hypothetical protein
LTECLPVRCTALIRMINLTFRPVDRRIPKKRKTEVKAIKGYISSVFCFELIVMNAKTKKQEQHIEILENVNR